MTNETKDGACAEISTVVSIYRAGGRVLVIPGEGRPKTDYGKPNSPLLAMYSDWYLVAEHEEIMNVLQHFLTDIQKQQKN